jgi:hypothetical protein
MSVFRTAVSDYKERGWKTIPIPAGHKHPKHKDWQSKDHPFETWHTGVGVQFGPPSDGLLDVDLDCPEAVELARFFLPETECVFGRKGAPCSHWLYVSDAWEQAETVTTQFTDIEEKGEHGVMLLELRTGRVDENGKVKGAQSMVPPSLHPSGERVKWDRDGEPAWVDADEIREVVSTVAAAALLVRHYPSKGRRHEAFRTLGGFLARASWDEERITNFVEGVVTVARDDQRADRIEAASSAVAAMNRGEQVSGTPRMVEIFGAPIVKKLRNWLGSSDIDSGDQTTNTTSSEQPKPRTIDEVVEVFQRWLELRDMRPVYAMVGMIAANLLPGDPVWLGLVGPPSSAKTELLNATARLPFVVRAATLTQAALLSGTPKKQRDRRASGGLLRQLGDMGILVCKDFGSVLSMRMEARAELLAALREIYDGEWTRHLGSDGGMTLSWAGKTGLLFGCTGVIDQHYSVIGAIGDRFLLSRFEPVEQGQFERALDHAGEVTKVMRAELAAAVAGLFVNKLPEPRPLSKPEIARLSKVCGLVVRLRGAVARDHNTKEIEAVYGAEGTARLGLTLERLLAGLDILGVDRRTAFDVVEKVAFDSVPPQRVEVYAYLLHNRKCKPTTTREVGEALGLPANTVRRRLEELMAYGVVMRSPFQKGVADEWITGPMGRPVWPESGTTKKSTWRPFDSRASCGEGDDEEGE